MVSFLRKKKEEGEGLLSRLDQKNGTHIGMCGLLLFVVLVVEPI